MDARRQMRRHFRLLAAAVAAVALRSLAFLPVFDGANSSVAETRSSRRSLLNAGLLGLSLQAFTGEADAYMERRVAYPPINRNDPDRCMWRGSNIAQANAQREKLQDLRECKMGGTNANDKDIAGALLTKGDFSKVTFKNGIMTKVVAQDSNFEGADFTNAVADRVEFKNSNFKDAIFKNALLTSSDFEGVNVENADFTDAFLDIQSVKVLCNNPTMKGKNPVTGADTYLSAGCDIADAGSYTSR
eukprot:CAMPEP_0114678934 /NCGR_PEP_ID=MMETSP0191-20121206/52358_1 /TAXON_ID=126664 /ORGANISM="Sorites sp." /LENGTH=244 /DNA_ID=CAMNT_0001953681 /DNA_START=48 /DNA_END=782 /DNA_ORIENTATION=+